MLCYIGLQRGAIIIFLLATNSAANSYDAYQILFKVTDTKNQTLYKHIQS